MPGKERHAFQNACNNAGMNIGMEKPEKIGEKLTAVPLCPPLMLQKGACIWGSALRNRLSYAMF
jgi:hypothetical protein